MIDIETQNLIDDLRAELKSVKDEWNLARDNLLWPALMGPGRLRFGGNIMQLDNKGMQVQAAAQTGAVWFVRDIVPNPSSETTYALIRATIPGAGSQTDFTFLVKADVDDSAQFSLDADTTGNSQASITLSQGGVVRDIVFAWSGTLWGTPATFNSTVIFNDDVTFNDPVLFTDSTVVKGANLEIQNAAGTLQVYLQNTDGAIVWGSGFDVNLYRGAANFLQTDDQFYAGDGVRMKSKAGVPTDGDTTVDADAVVIVDTTNNDLYFRSTSVWRKLSPVAVTNQTGTYNAVVNDFIRCSGTFTVTLPSAPVANAQIAVKNSGTGVITVARGGSDTIFTSVTAQTSFTLGPGDAVNLIYYAAGTEWQVY